MLSRSKAWAAALLAATFAAGVVVGAGAYTAWAHRGPDDAGRSRGVDRMVANLTAELRLTPVEHDSVQAILRRHFTELNGVWETVRPRFDSIRARMDSEVVRQLTPEQQAGYRDHVTRFRHRSDNKDSTEKKR